MEIKDSEQTGLMPIGTSSPNSSKFHGIRPRMYSEDLLYYAGDIVTLTLYNVRYTSQKHVKTFTSVIAAKTTVINEVYVFSIKYRYSDSDILLKNT